MTLLSMFKGFVIAAAAVALAGCSSSDGGTGEKCSGAPVVTGSPAFSSGTASVHGSGTLPAGIPDGQELELMDQMGNYSVGVLPTNLLDETLTCGAGFTFTITQLDAGTHSLVYNIYNPKSDSTDPTFTGTSTNTFVVADGQAVEFNPTF